MITFRKVLFTVLFIAVVTSVCLFVLIQKDNKIYQPVFSATVPTLMLPSPTPTSVGPIQVAEMDSPDGTKKLTMKRVLIKDMMSYSFIISDNTGSTEPVSIEISVKPSSSFSIPYNTWSPDNKYFFLKETSPKITSYLVFSSDGGTLARGASFLNIQDIFVEKVPNLVIEDVTGWADPILLIVNTKKPSGELGPSYWFEIPGENFTQLSSRFN